MPASPMSRLLAPFRRFRDSERGYMLVESVLILPFLVWGYISLYSYWQAYRTMTDLQKVAYSMSDLVSREQRTIDASYIAGLRDTMDTMLGLTDPDETGVRVRVTSIMWSELANAFVVEWSNSPSGMTAHDNASIAALIERIPDMTDGRTAIVVEVELDYEPVLSLGAGALPGLEAMTFSEFIVTPPRYAPRVVFQ